MVSSCKKDGIVLYVKPVSTKCLLCGILFSDSVYMDVFIGINSKILNLTCGHQVFGCLYSYNDKNIFNVESLDFFLGATFWKSGIHLLNLIKLVKVVINYVPKSLVLENLYDEFIIYVNSIHEENKDSSEEFKYWIIESIS